MKDNNKFMLGFGLGILASVVSIGTIGLFYNKYKKLKKCDTEEKSEKEILIEEIDEEEKKLILLNKNILKIDEILQNAWDDNKFTFIIPKGMTEQQFYALKDKREEYNLLVPEYKKRINDLYIKLQFIDYKEETESKSHE